jgi:hypothetical protein
MFTKSLLEDFLLLPSQIMFPYYFHYFAEMGCFKYRQRVYQQTFLDLRSSRAREKGRGKGGVRTLQIFAKVLTKINKSTK